MNKGDAAAAETFKRITNAYNAALKASAAGAASVASTRSTRGGGRATASRPGYTPPRQPTGPVDGSQFNTREWERAHYGMHGAKEEQSEFLRRAWRMRGPDAARYGRERPPQSGPERRAAEAAAAAAVPKGSAAGKAMMLLGVAVLWGAWAQSFMTKTGLGMRRSTASPPDRRRSKR